MNHLRTILTFAAIMLLLAGCGDDAKFYFTDDGRCHMIGEKPISRSEYTAMATGQGWRLASKLYIDSNGELNDENLDGESTTHFYLAEDSVTFYFSVLLQDSSGAFIELIYDKQPCTITDPIGPITYHGGEYKIVELNPTEMAIVSGHPHSENWKYLRYRPMTPKELKEFRSKAVHVDSIRR